MVKQNVVIGVFRHAESKSGLCFVLTPLLHRFFDYFSVQTHDSFCRLSVKRIAFLVKLGSQIFLNIRPSPK